MVGVHRHLIRRQHFGFLAEIILILLVIDSCASGDLDQNTASVFQLEAESLAYARRLYPDSLRRTFYGRA